MLLLLTLFSSRATRAADDTTRVLRELDSAALKFKTVIADFEWQGEQTAPFPDTETQTGTIYFKRNSSALQVSARIRLVNNKKVPKVLSYSNGTVTLFQKMTGELKVIKAGERQGQLESVLLLGFGSSGKDIESKWDVTFLRQEALAGVKCEVLELVPKDPEVKKNVRRVTIWLDASRDVSLKQIFDQGDGMRRICIYSNFKMNSRLPIDAFDPKADPR
jgi:outer membrane lipoprotein-sorting protein